MPDEIEKSILYLEWVFMSRKSKYSAEQKISYTKWIQPVLIQWGG